MPPRSPGCPRSSTPRPWRGRWSGRRRSGCATRERCLACGACSFLCPTCHCFDIQDEVTAEGGVRFRCWDTCQFGEFTRMGAGHNPRPTQKERVRQRVSHKFKYLVEEFGRLGCTGCGRCVEACPVNIDIRSVLARRSRAPSDERRGKPLRAEPGDDRQIVEETWDTKTFRAVFKTRRCGRTSPTSPGSSRRSRSSAWARPPSASPPRRPARATSSSP